MEVIGTSCLVFSLVFASIIKLTLGEHKSCGILYTLIILACFGSVLLFTPPGNSTTLSAQTGGAILLAISLLIAIAMFITQANTAMSPLLPKKPNKDEASLLLDRAESKFEEGEDKLAKAEALMREVKNQQQILYYHREELVEAAKILIRVRDLLHQKAREQDKAAKAIVMAVMEEARRYRSHIDFVGVPDGYYDAHPLIEEEIEEAETKGSRAAQLVRFTRERNELREDKARQLLDHIRGLLC